MKKLFSIISVILCVVTLMSVIPLTVNAATEGFFTYTVSDGKATLTKVYANEGNDIVIPSTLGGYPVVAIDLSTGSWLTSVVIPSSVEIIKDGSFAFCSKLKSVIIQGANLKTIERLAFGYCEELEKINIPKSVEKIEKEAFIGCSKLTDITLYESLTDLGDEVFSRCYSLKTVVIQGPIKSIGEKSFNSCKNLEEITIPASVKEIKNNAFEACASLKDVYYTGSESEWNNISIGSSNLPLTKLATIHYNHKIEIIFEDSYDAIVSGNLILVKTGLRLNELLNYAPEGTVIKAADGISDISGNTLGTGMQLILSNGTTYSLAVKGDLDGNGTIKASDARLALRASVRLENFNEAQNKAGDANNDGSVQTKDARLILRASVGIEKLPEFKEIPEVPTPPELPTIPAEPFAYFANSDFQDLKKEYPSAVANGAYVIAYIDKNGDNCVLTYINYKIINNYSTITLHNLSNNTKLLDPISYYTTKASNSSGATKTLYKDLAKEVQEYANVAMKGYNEMLNKGTHSGAGVFIDAKTLNQ